MKNTAKRRLFIIGAIAATACFTLFFFCLHSVSSIMQKQSEIINHYLGETASLVTANMRQIVILLVLTATATTFIIVLFVAYYALSVRKSYKQIERLTYYDDLTKLYNKKGYVEEAKQLLNKEDKIYAVVAFNINNFKAVNEAFGHTTSNIILRQIAEILSEETKETEICARDTADSFGAFFQVTTQRELEERLFILMQKMGKGTLPGGRVYAFSLRCGVNICKQNQSASEIPAIIDGALIALDETDGLFENTIAFCTEEMHAMFYQKNKIEQYMEKALEEEEFFIEFQPQVNLKTGEICGAEALIRWNSAELGLLQPGHFIPVFESNGFIEKIDTFVLRKVCEIQVEWWNKGYPLFPVSINQSRMLLHDEGYTEKTDKIVEEYRIMPELITLEITESVATEKLEKMHEVSKALKNKGFRISMDDFGSGYSSLNSLKEIVVDEIKLDGGFLANAEKENVAGKIIEKLIELTKEFEVDTVAEGVETAKQAEFLKEIGCNKAQGFFFARPMPKEEYEIFVYEKTK